MKKRVPENVGDKKREIERREKESLNDTQRLIHIEAILFLLPFHTETQCAKSTFTPYVPCTQNYAPSFFTCFVRCDT